MFNQYFSMAESYSKKENNKKKAQKKAEKLNKRELRKTVNNKGKSLDEMLVYVDVLGRLTDVHPSLQDKEKDLLEASKEAKEDMMYQGSIYSYETNKGFGFIKQDTSNDKVFFHFKVLSQEVAVGDTVMFSKQLTEKGYRATRINKIII